MKDDRLLSVDISCRSWLFMCFIERLRKLDYGHAGFGNSGEAEAEDDG